MAEVVGFIGLSHSPFWDRTLDVTGPGASFVQGVAEARAMVAREAPDALVVFGPDHFRNFFYDVLPPFCIGVERVNSFGDYGIAPGPLPVASALARVIHAGVSEAGFDPAISLKMGCDHGIVQPYDVLAPGRTLPIVPIMVNSGGAPRPSLRRCLDFGVAIGEAIRAYPGKERVMLLASGGLSHWVRPVSEEDPRTDADIRDYTIEGRERAVAYSAMRDRSVAERAAAGHENPVNDEWDRWFLDHVARGDLEPVLATDPAGMEEAAGNGAHEIRGWIAALGAWGGPVPTLSYEAVRAWATGMACAAAA